MSRTGLEVFDTTLDKTKAWLASIEEQPGPDRRLRRCQSSRTAERSRKRSKLSPRTCATCGRRKTVN